ncbi:MAG: tRNA preQ1(34) S-adenosylmethionine ribosyltransferase-isomerase QueA [Candidatus Magasanikbacteria bacterium]
MKTSDFDYNLPSQRIAQKPMEPRDHSRLMVIDREKKTLEHKKFFDIIDYLQKGDILVWNTSKVFKARLFGTLVSNGGEPLFNHTKPMEVFLVRPMENPGIWKVLAKPGKHLDVGTRVKFAEHFFCEAAVKEKTGTILVQFLCVDDEGERILFEEEVRKEANIYGHVPLPPYVKDEKCELEVYQTTYAKQEGSVAAPTAGFHFTPELIERLKEKGIEFAEVCLHVGLGTFLPVKTEKIEDHVMHSEWVGLSKENAKKIVTAKEEGGRIIAVGTTTVRTLEGIAQHGLKPYTGDINLFILPGFEFQIVDAMITNFHLPKSTLLMLVSTFAGDRKFMLECYREAVEKEYRFYSFGDAMFIQ